MTSQIYPCLWLDNQARPAAEFYCSLFSNSSIITESSLAVQIEIEGSKILCMNGGPMFKINPSISLFVTCRTNEEIEDLWSKLSAGGMAMMPLGSYPWSEKYGWVADRFGMTWQLMLDEPDTGQQKIVPLLLFVGDQFGKAGQAIETYTSIFQKSAVHHLELYKEGEPSPAGSLKFGRFSLRGSQFAAMDGFGDHEFRFNEGVSLVAECETQEEIDFLWEELTRNGKEVMCGWLTDPYGVSWQIIPEILGSVMSDPEKGQRVMKQIMQMKKLDISKILEA